MSNQSDEGQAPQPIHTHLAIGDALDQLSRYGDLADIRILEVLQLLTDINDDLCNGRAGSLVRKSCEQAKALLSAIADESAAS